MVSELAQVHVFDLGEGQKKGPGRKAVIPQSSVGEPQTASVLNSRGDVKKIDFPLSISLNL